MIRLAKTEDLNNITDVYSYARKFMAENGNPTQWGTNYPSEQLIENDINNKKMYVIEEENQIHAVFMFDICEDETYEVIKNGLFQALLFDNVSMEKNHIRADMCTVMLLE